MYKGNFMYLLMNIISMLIIYIFIDKIYIIYFIIIFLLILYRETYIERNPGESTSDRNDRAIRMAAKWYNTHLNLDHIKIKTVLLTDDAQNRELAKNEGIPTISSKIFF